MYYVYAITFAVVNVLEVFIFIPTGAVYSDSEGEEGLVLSVRSIAIHNNGSQLNGQFRTVSYQNTIYF